jgi:hypothetical protein
VSAQPKAKTSHVVTSVASHSSAHHGNASLPVSEVRDELVRVVMPELRVLMEHLVAGAVERSLAPLLEKQRELEESIKELRSAQVRSAQAAAATTKPAVEMASARVIAVDPRPVAPVSPAVYREAVPVDVVTYREAPVTAPAQPNRETKGNVYQAPHRAARLDSMEDIPSELNGSRRKKLLMVAFAVALFVLILSAVGLSVMSNLGTHL